MKTHLWVLGEGGSMCLPEDIGVTIKRGKDELGVIFPVSDGVKIVSPHIENRRDLFYVEPQDPPAIHISLHRQEVTPATVYERDVLRPHQLEEAIETSLRHVHATIFGDNGFTHAESVWAWGQVIEKLLISQNLDLQRVMLGESLMRRQPEVKAE